MTFLLYIAASAVGGLLVGLLGTGSSLIILPSLTLIFATTLHTQDPLRLAAGTTMATIAVGAIAGALAQYRSGRLDLKLFRTMLLPYAIGASAGPWTSRLLPANALAIYVAGIVVVVALLMIMTGGSQRKPARDYRSHRLELSLALLAIAFGSSVAGIASGIFAIPYLSRFSLPMRTVIGTSTASAAVYATVAAIGYVSAGWHVDGLPEPSLGFVYLPAFVVMAVTAAIATPQGVRLAGKISERALRRAFAVFLLAAAAAIVRL
jgi:uncharacterized membrane protein YfcA